MKIKKTITAGLATVGITVGMLLAASPAHAVSYYSKSFTTKQACVASTAAKVAGLSVAGKKNVRVAANCVYYKNSAWPYFTLIKYS